MKLKTIKRIYNELHAEFERAGCPLSVIPFRKTRTNDYWACYDDGAKAYYWSKYLSELTELELRSVVFHEMIHQWQDEYIPFLCSDDHHDFWFWGWQATANRLELKFFQEL